MLKKFLTTIYLLALSSTPTHAYPVWATAIARSQCEYMAMGIGWKTSVDQSLRDNAHWMDEVLNNRQLAAKVIVRAAYDMCPNIYQAVFQEYENQQPTKPAYLNEFKL